jgi:UDP-N-acetylmuramoyl-tripeptide--D-alanyl-D-alanine ligase
MRLTLGFVLQTLMDYQVTGGEPSITSVVIDSRLAQPGSLFFAFEGENVDGHEYVQDAIDRGAIVCLVEKVVPGELAIIDARLTLEEQGYRRDNLPTPLCLLIEDTLKALQRLGQAWRQKFNTMRVIGITGSVGKTTTKELTHSVLAQRYKTLKSEGNYNNEIGLPLTLLQIKSQYERAVLEMGMYTSGEISLLCELAKPQIGVVTIIGAVHMEWLGSIEAIAAAKQELIESLPSGPDGVAILNIDDPLVMAMADHTQASIFTYGLDEKADLWADNIVSIGLDGIRFALHYNNERLNVQVPLLGRHSVHTALRAAAVGLVEELSWEEIVAGLQDLGSQLRLVVVPGPRDSIILDDTYNSSPESAVAALNLLADLDGRRIAVLGDMLELGPVEETSHRLVGRRVRDVANVLLTVGQRGRLIAEEALAFGMPPDHVHIVEVSDEAIPILERVIEHGDFVLVKGSRGVHLDRIINAVGRD